LTGQAAPGKERRGREMGLLDSMSLEEKIGQMVMVGFEGPELTPSDEEFIGEIRE